MKDETVRAARILIDKTAPRVIDYLIRTRLTPTESQIERDLAQKYGEIAEKMAGHVGEVVKPEAKPINVSYCLECCQRHYSKAHGLLEEAERFSLKEGKLTPDAAQKVRKAVEELVTSEDDLDSTQASPEVRKNLDGIKDKMRDVRKKAWENKISFEGASLDALREMKAGVDDLAERTYELMAEATRRGGEQEVVATPLKVLELKKLSAEERARMLHEVYETSKHLDGAMDALKREDFKLASESLEKAIESTSCAECQRMIARAGIDASYVGTLKEIESEDYQERRQKTIDSLKFIRDDYLPSTSEIKEA